MKLFVTTEASTKAKNIPRTTNTPRSGQFNSFATAHPCNTTSPETLSAITEIAIAQTAEPNASAEPTINQPKNTPKADKPINNNCFFLYHIDAIRAPVIINNVGKNINADNGPKIAISRVNILVLNIVRN